MYNELVYHLDLCILSYQLHAQTLAWPMDPYYEQMARFGTSRRDNFKEKARIEIMKVYPNYPKNLDPIKYNYQEKDSINPRAPCFVSPETGKWVFYNTPKKITDCIGNTFIVKRGFVAKSPKHNCIKMTQAGSGASSLYCFEGGTGGIAKQNKPAAQSLMGFVMVRPLPDASNPGNYAIHIVFRGSRSGDAARALIQAGSKLPSSISTRRGNPDWVTDMQYANQSKDPIISPDGHCSEGFATSVKEMLPTITQCLVHIHNTMLSVPVPAREIYVTGHSLGGALATLFSSAMVKGTDYGPIGKWGPKMPTELKEWPWKCLQLITYGAPIVGDGNFEKKFNQEGISLRRIVHGKDLVARSPQRFAQQLGKLVSVEVDDFTSWIRNKKEGREESHEPYLIRRALIDTLTTDEKAEVPENVATKFKDAFKEDNDEPWKKYTSFYQVLYDKNFEEAREHSLRKKTFIPELNEYIQILTWTLGKTSSYKKLWKPDQAGIKQIQTIKFGDVMAEAEIAWKSVNDTFAKNMNDESTGKFLGLCLLLASFSCHPHQGKFSYGTFAELLREI